MNDRRTVRSTYTDRSESVPLSVGRPVATGAILLGLFAVVGTAVLGLSLWWFKWRVNAEAEIRQDSFNFQQTARDQVVDFGQELAAIDVQLADPNLTDKQQAALGAQRIAVADSLCDLASDIHGTTSPVVAELITRECP